MDTIQIQFLDTNLTLNHIRVKIPRTLKQRDHNFKTN